MGIFGGGVGIFTQKHLAALIGLEIGFEIGIAIGFEIGKELEKIRNQNLESRTKNLEPKSGTEIWIQKSGTEIRILGRNPDTESRIEILILNPESKSGSEIWNRNLDPDPKSEPKETNKIRMETKAKKEGLNWSSIHHSLLWLICSL